MPTSAYQVGGSTHSSANAGHIQLCASELHLGNRKLLASSTSLPTADDVVSLILQIELTHGIWSGQPYDWVCACTVFSVIRRNLPLAPCCEADWVLDAREPSKEGCQYDLINQINPSAVIQEITAWATCVRRLLFVPLETFCPSSSSL